MSVYDKKNPSLGLYLHLKFNPSVQIEHAW